MGAGEISTIPLEPYPAELEDSKRRLEQLGRQRVEGKVPFDTVTRIGDPALEIVRAVADFEADLVVMATHGRKGVSHFFLGSVAERVVRRSPAPVLTIRPKKAAAEAIAAEAQPAAQGKKGAPR
jgi:nucleotide-binding universal stress UspA family protein